MKNLSLLLVFFSLIVSLTLSTFGSDNPPPKIKKHQKKSQEKPTKRRKPLCETEPNKAKKNCSKTPPLSTKAQAPTKEKISCLDCHIELTHYFHNFGSPCQLCPKCWSEFLKDAS